MRVVFTPEPLAGARSRHVLAPGKPLVVGRGEDASIVLRDPRLSRRHATLVLEPRTGVVRLTNHSANGSFVDGREVAADGAILTDGCVARVGDSFLVHRLVPHENEDRPVEGLFGDAPTMRALRRTLHLVGPSDATVLVLGESGTGKELAARALHTISKRPGRFVAVNCSAIPGDIAESQLFGHVVGAFTGAQRSHDGFFRAADRGTLFLDEIGELPATLQPKLLRALEEHAITPVGSTQPVPCDVRIVAATHQDLAARVEDGSFRGDLFARIAEIVVRTPALCERREDIVPLLVRALGPSQPTLDPELVHALLVHEFRYNVRELLKIARELAVLGAGRERLDLGLIGSRLGAGGVASGGVATEGERPPAAVARAEGASPPQAPTRELLESLLRTQRGNVSGVARALGRSRRQVHRYLEEHGLDPARFR